MVATQSFGTKPISKPVDAIPVAVGADLQSLVDAAPAGSTFWIEAGVHRMQSVTPKDGDHFIGEHGAVLNGARLITEFDREGHNWVATGQNQEGFRSGTEFGARGAERPGYPETFFIDNKPLTPVDSLDKVAPGKFYFDYGHDKIYFRDDPAGHRVEAGVSPFAIAGQAKDVHVENLVVEKYNVPTQAGAIGYNSSAEGWTIQNNEVRLNYGVGVYAGSNSHVTGNYVHDNGQMGLGASGDNVRVEGNEIAHNGYFSGIDRGWEGGGTKFAETENLIVRDNYSHDNNGYGLWTDINNINTLYEGNTVANNLSGGINHEISYAATIRDNVLTGNGGEGVGWLWNGGIQIQNSKNVDVYRNYVDASEGGNAITMIQQDRGTGSHGAWTTTGNSVHDNVIVDRTPGEGASGAIADYNQAGLAAGGNSFDHNHYHNPHPSDERWAWTDGFYSWDAYRHASGQDAHSTISTDIPDAPAIPVSAALAAVATHVGAEQSEARPVVMHTDEATPHETAAPREPAVPSEPAGVAPPVATAPEAAGSDVPTVAEPGVSKPVTSAAPDVPSPHAPIAPVASAPSPVASEPEPSTAGSGRAEGHAPAIEGANPWSDLLGGHSGTWILDALTEPRSPGSHPDLASPSIENALQHYVDLAEQHCAGQIALDAGVIGDWLDQFHHAKTGEHTGLAL